MGADGIESICVLITRIVNSPKQQAKSHRQKVQKTEVAITGSFNIEWWRWHRVKSLRVGGGMGSFEK